MPRLAVHLHLYYLDQLSEVLCYLKSLDGQRYDLFVTMVEDNQEATAKIIAAYPNAHIMIVPNYGYDIGPFIEFLHKIDLDAYDLILKIHTKGSTSQNHTWLNGQCLDNKLWGHILLDVLLKDKERVQSNLAMFDSKKVGMLSSAYCLAKEKRTYQKLLPRINQELKVLGLPPVQSVRFIAGTMFYARPQIFKPLLHYTIEDFEVSASTVKEGTMAHIVERLLGILVEQAGFTIQAIKHDNYTRKFMLIAIKHFLYQKKITNTGHKIIKIFRIPVYHKKG